MSQLAALRSITTKPELAKLLGVNPSMFTNVLYRLPSATKYTSFTIPKKSGGYRTIFAPSDQLKSIQSSLSNLLQDCIDEINKAKQTDGKYRSTLSHGFVRDRSIITNAMMHLNQRNVLNIDLADYFDSFNFGRVRGFFIANNHFKLDTHIATVIAQIACREDKLRQGGLSRGSLPQGSPCSPVITNLITHSLDIRLASLAKKYSCTYSRYADDITISTRESEFPSQIMEEESDKYIAGKKLKSEIKRAGFEINQKKTRIQYKDSRQDVTGLVVNKKPNVKSEYWRIVRSQCHSLFRTGTFTKEVEGHTVKGNLNELEGQLNFIDQVDFFNRLRQKPPLNPVYKFASHNISTSVLLSGREKTFSRFLYYRLFYGNIKPTILCEGKTDNVYLKAAISALVATYPTLAIPKTNGVNYKLLVSFLNYTKRTRFLLQLFGGTSYLNFFIGSFDKHYKFYKAPKPVNPVIIVLDNDSGFKGKKESGIEGKLKSIGTAKSYPITLEVHDFRNAEFIHVIHNLYIVLTPLSATGQETAIEDLFDVATRQIQISGKFFNPKVDKDNENEYGKEVFANKVVKAQKSTINFFGLTPLLDRIVKAIDHYATIK